LQKQNPCQKWRTFSPGISFRNNQCLSN